MEKSYGIEAARAQLGDIANHVRDTGQIIELTRHGRTVAVVGPAEAVKPAQGFEVIFLLPANRETFERLPGVPRKGDIVRRENGQAEETWIVEQVEWRIDDADADTIGEAMLFVYLAPGDDYTKALVAGWENEAKANRIRKRHTNKES
ncbi:type II toxin-antitoxin system prevent-host-death family antitoxin [Streptomyces sp. NPDC006476]|uniref:type II toxin-antitoxin system prevent-host-death family antitoxin n=1 Tax=Streptomyces sp. NPDC006476 TaxID=3157175 RepID=UPI0033A9A0D3